MCELANGGGHDIMKEYCYNVYVLLCVVDKSAHVHVVANLQLIVGWKIAWKARSGLGTLEVKKYVHGC